MQTLSVTFLALLTAASSWASEVDSALSALKTLPEGDRLQLAGIAGREGAPTPERWYFQVYSPGSANGVREYVVENRRLVAMREVSQFAPELKPADMLGGNQVKVDSTRVASLARRYAKANNRTVASLDYTLNKPFPDAKAVWTVKCLDSSGETAGTLTLAAENGTVIAHDGFANEPPPAAEVEKPAPKSPASVAADAPAPSRPAARPEAERETDRAPVIIPPKSKPQTGSRPAAIAAASAPAVVPKARPGIRRAEPVETVVETHRYVRQTAATPEPVFEGPATAGGVNVEPDRPSTREERPLHRFFRRVFSKHDE